MPAPSPLTHVNPIKARPRPGTGIADTTNYQWWLSSEAQIGDDMIATARRIASRQSYMREQFLWLARMHGGVAIAGLSPGSQTRTATQPATGGFGGGQGEPICFNVIENVCASAQAEICSNKPKMTFATDEGDWYKQEEADKLTSFLEGNFYEINAYTIGRMIALDAMIFGTGIVKSFETDDERSGAERVPVWELLVDDADGRDMNPMCMYHVKFLDRRVAMQLWPKQADKIAQSKAASIGNERDPFMYDTTADLIQIIEGWRRPSSKKAKDGRHVVAIPGVCITDEEWKRDEFPFSFYRWMKRPLGFWGKGIVEQIAGIQREINKLAIRIQRNIARLAITRVFVETGSKVNVNHLRSNDGDIINYTGRPPILDAPTAVNPQIIELMWQYYAKAYELTGISQMTAQGQAPPPGVDSGKAIRTLLQNHSKRLNDAAQSFEEFFMDLGQKQLGICRDIAERKKSDAEKGGYVVTWSTTTGKQAIDFSEIDLKADDVVMRPYPTSALPSNPGEKMQTVQEWFNAGSIDADEMRMLMDWPDIKGINDLNPVITLKRAILRRLTDMVKKGKAWTPDSFVDPKIAKPMAVAFLIDAEQKGAPENKLDLVRQFIEDLVSNEAGNGPGAAAPGAGGAPPGSAPGSAQLAQPGPSALPSQVEPIGPMSNPAQPQAAA